MQNENINAVENIIRSWLKSLGYFKIVINEVNETSIKFLADGNLRSIVLDVKIGKSPHEPKPLSSKEIKKIRQFAMSSYREPWAAKVKINSEGKLANDIEWTNLTGASH